MRKKSKAKIKAERLVNLARARAARKAKQEAKEAAKTLTEQPAGLSASFAADEPFRRGLEQGRKLGFIAGVKVGLRALAASQERLLATALHGEIE